MPKPAIFFQRCSAIVNQIEIEGNKKEVVRREKRRDVEDGILGSGESIVLSLLIQVCCCVIVWSCNRLAAWPATMPCNSLAVNVSSKSDFLVATFVLLAFFGV